MRRQLISSLRSLHAPVRRAVGLPGPAPDPSPFIFTPQPDGTSSLTMKDAELVHAEREAWHQEGRRARVIARVFDELERAVDADPVDDVRRHLVRLRRRREARQVLQATLAAPQIEWSAYHWAGAGDVQHIDGHLVAGGRRRTLDMSCAGDTLFWAQDAVRGGGMLERGEGGAATVVLPTQVIGRGMIETALRLWYMDQAAGIQGHWSVRACALPQIVIDQPWEDGSPHTEAAAAAEREAIDALNAALREAAQDTDVVRGWALHGVTLDDLLVAYPD